MRILHLADVHIGVENYGRVDPETGLSTRLQDFLDTYDEAVDFALENGVDLVLFCGDAYKSRDPSQTHQREFARRVNKLASKGVSVFLLVGNHDTPHVIGRATALEIFETLEVPNVYIADNLQTYHVQTRAGPIQVVAVPWIRRSAFLAREDSRGLTPDQVNEAIQERLARAVRSQAEGLDASIPAVLAGHVSVGQAELSSEQTMMVGRDYVLMKSDLALPQFDYVALGHIHRHQILGRDPHVVYSGSLQRVDFGEEKDEKGFCVLDLDANQPLGARLEDFGFHAVNARPFLTIPVSVSSGDLNPTATVVKEISKYHIEGAVVRLQITVPGELEGHLHDGEIRAALEGANFVASISKQVLDRPRTRLGAAYSKGLDPKEALAAYLESRSVPSDRAKILMSYAETLIDEDASE